MSFRLCFALAVVLSGATDLAAHRLDEYLQATMISVETGRIQLSLRLIPGVAAAQTVLRAIDSNGDGVISQSERADYAGRVVRDLSLTVDGVRLQPHVTAVEFPTLPADLTGGLGEIHIDLSADVPPGGPDRKLVFENHHQRSNAAYLVNCLLPRDRHVAVLAQSRNETQSFYQLDYRQTNLAPRVATPPSLSALRRAGALSMFRLGMRHIAEGTDHLLFLLTLLLPAPLLARDLRWHGAADTRRSLLQILEVVSAFTLGHSMTLAVAALGLLRVPGRPVELLIAVSILVSAVHALRPLFPGREARIAAFFGLVHGLAFASTLTGLGLGPWDRVTNLLGFNIGIEAMQLLVVAAVLPSLLLLSRTGVYPMLRIGGGVFAGVVSLGWIAERLFEIASPADLMVNSVARHGILIAGLLSVCGVLSWLLRRVDLSGQPGFTARPVSPSVSGR